MKKTKRVVAESESWLYENKSAKAAVHRGLSQAKTKRFNPTEHLVMILFDARGSLVSAWEEAFRNRTFVRVLHSSVEGLPRVDAIVSPANSFGFMDGGIDLAYTNKFGNRVQDRVQNELSQNWGGELPVGCAVIVPTENEKAQYLISAPTMRVPMLLEDKTVNPYLATRAALRLVKYGTFEDGTPVSDKVRTIAIPGMGTGTGKVPPKQCAWQMLEAYNEVTLGPVRLPTLKAYAIGHRLLLEQK